MPESPSRSTTRRAGPMRILIVDDSPAFQDSIEAIIRTNPAFEVVGRASDGEQALQMALELDPGCICLDLQMPRMDGFTFLRMLAARKPMPVVVISSVSRKQDAFRALGFGAFEFVAKPDLRDEAELGAMREELLRKLLAIADLRVIPRSADAQAAALSVAGAAATSPPAASVAPANDTPARVALHRVGGAPARLVVIGASTGGPGAVARLLAAMPRGLPVAYAIAQHMPERFTESFAARLARTTGFDVREARDGDELLQGRVLVAPGGHHLKLVRAGGARRSVRASVFPSDGSEPRRYCPSVDLLFESAAEAMGDRVCAVVLTGMGSDGSEGVAKVKEAGGMALAESAETAIVFGMPREAADTGKVDEVLSLEEIAIRLRRFAEHKP